jgi:UDP-GlcNAc:undecaprenyl-phosphate GlcNAc-1-phosphate transferase
MDIIVLLLYVATLILIELTYFKIADHFNIIDKPNHRSSHTSVTLRGGGIIFSLGMFIYPIFYRLENLHFLMGLLMISTISFIDDIRPLTNKLRIFIQVIASSLLIWECGIFSLPFYYILIVIFLIIGCINAVNFMDGINGITGLYSLLTVVTLLYIDANIIHFISTELLIAAICSLLVFLYFNFRIKAKCFAGDVGSVGIAFIIIFLILKLVITSQEVSYTLLLLLYGLDVISTIVFRIFRKEKISEAHRSHFYQFLANERNLSQLSVSATYALIQGLINIYVILFLPHSVFYITMFIFLSTFVFMVVRIRLEGLKALINSKR